MASIRDISKKAGVSPTTTSKVLNGSGNVSQDSIDKVQAAANELGYNRKALGKSPETPQKEVENKPKPKPKPYRIEPVKDRRDRNTPTHTHTLIVDHIEFNPKRGGNVPKTSKICFSHEPTKKEIDKVMAKLTFS